MNYSPPILFQIYIMRSAVLTAASLGLTGLVLGNAWFQRQQFYPSVVYITKSNPSMAVIYLQVSNNNE